MEWAANVMVPMEDTRDAKVMCPRQLVVLVAEAGRAMVRASLIRGFWFFSSFLEKESSFFL